MQGLYKLGREVVRVYDMLYNAHSTYVTTNTKRELHFYRTLFFE